jgi:hypothetical protein
MTYRTKAMPQAEIEEHLSRAEELGVSLKEYALAYNVNLNTLANAKATRKKPSNSELAPGDFIKVNVEPSQTSSSLCTLNLPGGCSLECHEWPPAHWLQSLLEAQR